MKLLVMHTALLGLLRIEDAVRSHRYLAAGKAAAYNLAIPSRFIGAIMAIIFSLGAWVMFGAVCVAIAGVLTYPIWSVIFVVGKEQASRAAARAFLRRLEREPQTVKAELERYGFGTVSDYTPVHLRETIRVFIRNYPSELQHYRQLGIL
nr:hypothetical protein [Burkholderia gladioli]